MPLISRPVLCCKLFEAANCQRWVAAEPLSPLASGTGRALKNVAFRLRHSAMRRYELKCFNSPTTMIVRQCRQRRSRFKSRNRVGRPNLSLPSASCASRADPSSTLSRQGAAFYSHVFKNIVSNLKRLNSVSTVHDGPARQDTPRQATVGS